LPRTLLIAGGSHSDIPLIREAKALGFRTVTTGMCPDDLGHALSDQYIPGDYSDPDQMLDVFRKSEADAICACCNDFSAISCAAVTERLGLPGHDSLATSLTIHHKDRYRQFAHQHGIPTPRAIPAGSFAEGRAAGRELGPPVIVKPVDLTGGKGISVARSEAELEQSLALALSMTRCSRIVIEQFLDGTRHGYTAFLVNRRVVFSMADDEHYYKNPFAVSGATSPGSLTNSQLDELKATAERVADLLQLVDGILHIQLICHQSRPVILEICRRAPGDLYVDLVRHSAGVNYPEWIVRAEAGLPLDCVVPTHKRRYVTRHCIMPPRNGFLERIEIDPDVESRILDSLVWGRPGDSITSYLTQKHGILFIEHRTDAQRESASRLPELVRVSVTPKATP
jgi:biotin carboxylase